MDIGRKTTRPSAENFFHDLHGKKKLQYIWDYYKLPLIILGIFLYITISIIHGWMTHRDVVLYTALINVSAGENLTEDLSGNFLKSQNMDTAKYECYLYSDLYLTDDQNNPWHEYTYASSVKILAAIDGKQIDVVLMNKEAFDAFSQNGYLCDLDELLSKENPALYEKLKPCLITNAVDLSESPVISRAGFEDTVYLGIIANSPRKITAVSYLQYLFSFNPIQWHSPLPSDRLP